MAHYQNWLLENKVVYVKFWGDVDANEIGVAFNRSNDLTKESTTPPVHFLHNWSDVASFPKRLHELYRLSKTVQGDSRRVGWVVAFGSTNVLMRFLGDVFFQMFRVRFKMFNEEEEAITFLHRMDGSLPDLPELPNISMSDE